MRGSATAVVDALRAATSVDRVRLGSTELGLYRRDASNLDGDPGVVCFPVTTAEVQQVVRSLNYANTLYVPGARFFADPQWSGITDWAEELAPYYDQAARMLGVADNPAMTPADVVMKQVADDMGVGHTFRLTPVGVFFGEGPGVRSPDPFFAVLASYNPHRPFPIAGQHYGTHQSEQVPRTPSFNARGTGEPAWRKDFPIIKPGKVAELDLAAKAVTVDADSARLHAQCCMMCVARVCFQNDEEGGA